MTLSRTSPRSGQAGSRLCATSSFDLARGRAALALSAALVLFAVGCSGVPVRVRPYDPTGKAEQAGAVYFLPKARIEIAFTVKLDAGIDDARCESIVSECKYHFSAPEILDVAISTQPLPDPKAGFVIETNGTFVTGTDFTGLFSPKGELTEVSAYSQEHAIEFVSEGVSAIAKLAGLVSMAGPTQAATIQAQYKRKRALLSLLAKSDAGLAEAKPCISAPPAATPAPSPNPGGKVKGSDPKPPSKPPSPPAQASSPPPPACVSPEDLKKTLELRRALLQEVNDIDKELSVSREVRIRCAFEPPKRLGSVDIRKDGGVCPAYTALKLELAQSGFDVPLPTLTVQWAAASALDKSAAVEPLLPAALRSSDNSYPGIVYRIPEWFTIMVTRSARGDAAAVSEIESSGDVVAISGDVVAMAGDIVALPQFGKLVTTSFDERDLRSGRELRVELHQGQGSLKRLSFRATPIDVSKLQQITDKIPALPRPASPAPADEAARLNDETRRILAEKAYIEALQELNDAKRRRATEGKPKTNGAPPSQGGEGRGEP